MYFLSRTGRLTLPPLKVFDNASSQSTVFVLLSADSSEPSEPVGLGVCLCILFECNHISVSDTNVSSYVCLAHFA